MKKQKVLHILIAMVMALSMSSTVFAAEMDKPVDEEPTEWLVSYPTSGTMRDGSNSYSVSGECLVGHNNVGAITICVVSGYLSNDPVYRNGVDNSTKRLEIYGGDIITTNDRASFGGSASKKGASTAYTAQSRVVTGIKISMGANHRTTATFGAGGSWSGTSTSTLI